MNKRSKRTGKLINEGTTDHFYIIVGRGYDKEKNKFTMKVKTIITKKPQNILPMRDNIPEPK